MALIFFHLNAHLFTEIYSYIDSFSSSWLAQSINLLCLSLLLRIIYVKVLLFNLTWNTDEFIIWMTRHDKQFPIYISSIAVSNICLLNALQGRSSNCETAGAELHERCERIEWKSLGTRLMSCMHRRQGPQLKPSFDLDGHGKLCPMNCLRGPTYYSYS